MTTLVLASASPRRWTLLHALGRAPESVVPAAVDERARDGERAAALVRRLARAKRDAVVAETGSGTDTVVLGADTVVALGATVLGKPRDDDDARAMLRAVSDRVATVWSGVAVVGPRAAATRGAPATVVVATFVRFRALGDDEIDRYVATGEPTGAAGGFRLQGRGGALVAATSGCPTNVVGLPLCATATLLAGRCRPLGRPDCAAVVDRLRASDAA